VLVFITKTLYVLREVGTELLNIMPMNLEGEISTIYGTEMRAVKLIASLYSRTSNKTRL
jgi:hypothetical protein